MNWRFYCRLEYPHSVRQAKAEGQHYKTSICEEGENRREVEYVVV